MVKWHIPVPGWRVWDDRQKQWRKATADERSSVGGSRGAILPVAPFCQIRYRADVPRVSLPSISMDQLVKPLFGFWVTSARRRNFLWPLYLEAMGDDRESVLSAWQRISRLQTLPFPAYAVCDFENDLPEIIMERLRTKAFTGDPPTKKSFSTEFPTADVVLPNCDFLLSDSDPFVLDFVSTCSLEELDTRASILAELLYTSTAGCRTIAKPLCRMYYETATLCEGGEARNYKRNVITRNYT